MARYKGKEEDLIAMFVGSSNGHVRPGAELLATFHRHPRGLDHELREQAAALAAVMQSSFSGLPSSSSRLVQGQARPGQPPEHGKQQHAAITTGKELHSCPRGAGICPHSPNGAKKLMAAKAALENTCKSPPSASTAPSGGFAAHLPSQQRLSPSSNQPLYIYHSAKGREKLSPTLSSIQAHASAQDFAGRCELHPPAPVAFRKRPRSEQPGGRLLAAPSWKSNHQPDTSMPTKPYLKCHVYMVFELLQGCYLGEETDTHLSTASFQRLIRSPLSLLFSRLNSPSSLGSVLPLLIRLVLQTLHQLRCPSLDTLQHLNVSLVVGGPKLNTVFEVRPHQCRVQGHDHFPSPAGHAISHTSPDAIGFLGHLGTLLAHIQAAVNQHPQVLLCLAAFQPLFPKPVALHGVAVTRVQDPALSLVPLQSLPALKQINTPTQLGVICKLTEGALDPLIQIIDKDTKQDWPQY
ncbi:hypothetical protein QYF61_012097 [Mycteria americana]|uniref:Uncharacterized protein n=1 Tax=Mycteria americana TaxID=33587 RepID=A0AAN7N452_MYCAM|nr:hypothetical protein QYF61_012097 [Mycteria americana]